MAITRHVFGPCLINVGQAGGSTSQLGYSSEGLLFNQFFLKNDVISDRFGPLCPVDAQNMLSYIEFEFELVEWDATVINTITVDRFGGTPGTIGGPGVFMLQGGYSWRVAIASGYSEPTVNFVNCFPLEVSLNESTTYARAFMRWRALPNSAGVIYNNTAPS